MEELRDKAVNGLECCLNDPNEFGDCASKECPYKGVNCQSDLLRDTLVLLKTQDKELELLRKVKRGEIKKYANADFVIINGDFYRKYPPLCATTEPRVLSLEEANKYCAKGDPLEISEKQPLYVEYKGGGRPWAFRWLTVESLSSWLISAEMQADYGKEWRVWTARPTEEQRRAAKWDE